MKDTEEHFWKIYKYIIKFISTKQPKFAEMKSPFEDCFYFNTCKSYYHLECLNNKLGSSIKCHDSTERFHLCSLMENIFDQAVIAHRLGDKGSCLTYVKKIAILLEHVIDHNLVITTDKFNCLFEDYDSIFIDLRGHLLPRTTNEYCFVLE